MKHEIQAGAQIDVPTLDEIRDATVDALRDLAAWDQRPDQLTLRCAPMALAPGEAAPVTVDGSNIGPRSGRVWEIRRISVTGGRVALHLDDSSPSAYVDTVGTALGESRQFGAYALIMRSGQGIIIQNPLNIAQKVAVNVAVIDITP